MWESGRAQFIVILFMLIDFFRSVSIPYVSNCFCKTIDLTLARRPSLHPIVSMILEQI